MTQPTYLYFKEATTDTVIQAEVASILNESEVIQSVTVAAPTPLTTIPLIVEYNFNTNNTLQFTVKNGSAGCSYGCDVTLATNQRSLSILLAFQCNYASSELIPYETRNPDAFKDLVGEIQAGSSAVGTAVFSFPNDFDPIGGYVLWELIAEDGTVYSAGNAFDYRIDYTGFANNVLARAIVSVPSDIPETLEQQKYQIRWTHHVNDSTSFQFENITVVGVSSVPIGTVSTIELQGDPALIELVTDELYDRIGVELYVDNRRLTDTIMISDTSQPATAPAPQKVATGWFVQAVVDTDNLTPSVKPYTARWKYWQSKTAYRQYTERSDFWIVNPALMSAMDDVKAKVNKARTTLYGAPDLLFPYPTIMTWLRRAADAFNGYAGVFTNFTFTNPLSGIREYWLMFAELFAIESQYLAEGEKAFDFQGQAISLNVDRTQYLDNMASKIQSRIDNELKPFKQNLIIKGNTGGDGSSGGGGDLVSSAAGAMGTVGITITPASLWGRWIPGDVLSLIPGRSIDFGHSCTGTTPNPSPGPNPGTQVVLTVNGQEPDVTGNVEINTGVMTVDHVLPDVGGNVNVSTDEGTIQ